MPSETDIVLVVENKNCKRLKPDSSVSIERNCADADGDVSVTSTETEHEREIACNKRVLIESSDYFRAMFSDTNNFVEAKSRRVVMRDVDGDALEFIVDFLHQQHPHQNTTGNEAARESASASESRSRSVARTAKANTNANANRKIAVSSENAHSVLRLANSLQIQQVESHCIKFLTTKLKKENWLDVLETGESLGSTQLVGAARQFVASHFDELRKSEEFKKLKEADVLSILDGRSDAMSDEAAVLETEVEWIRANEKERKKSETIRALMEKIRIGQLSRIGTNMCLTFFCNKLLAGEDSYFETLRKPCIEANADWTPAAMNAMAKMLDAHYVTAYSPNFTYGIEASDLLLWLKRDLEAVLETIAATQPATFTELKKTQQLLKISDGLLWCLGDFADFVNNVYAGDDDSCGPQDLRYADQQFNFFKDYVDLYHTIIEGKPAKGLDYEDEDKQSNLGEEKSTERIPAAWQYELARANPVLFDLKLNLSDCDDASY